MNYLWKRYQEICDKPSWEALNEARAILYFVGKIYCEKIAPEAIERRLHLLEKPLKLVDFFILVDSESKELDWRRKDALFLVLEKYYNEVKKFKNKFVGGKYYLDEERFVNLYNKYNPNKKLKIRERGNFLNNGKAQHFLRSRNSSKRIIAFSNGKLKKIKGEVASQGMAKGVAKIILGSQDFKKMKKNNVLIAHMTTPEYMSVIKKAGAIITDEGGITCHAAIIARELKKTLYYWH